MPNIRHELLIEASIETVFNAITTEEGLSAWWTPETRAKPETNSISRFAFGPDYFKEMAIKRLDAPKEVVWECIRGTQEWVGTTLRFSLDEGSKDELSQSHPELGDQLQQQGSFRRATVLAFSQDGWRDYTPMFGECNYTWGQFLRGLKAFCEVGKGRPWPNQHQGGA
jgi:uncharacterized protein YndB with AHSA1/START domain